MGYQEIMDEYNKKLKACSGKSVDELLAIANGNDLDFLFAIEMAIQQKSDRVGDQNLSKEERIVLAIEALEREVNNGGYSQFFTNSSGEYAPIIVDSLLCIGCPETAKITKQAIDTLGTQDLSPETLESIFESENEARDGKLNECDQMYYEAGVENIGGKLIDFVKANKNVIQP
jgi:hypothetical protein